jgi:hypothetical protein
MGGALAGGSWSHRYVVLEGKFGYVIGERSGVAAVGETLVCPVGVTHTQWNAAIRRLGSTTSTVRP